MTSLTNYLLYPAHDVITDSAGALRGPWQRAQRSLSAESSGAGGVWATCRGRKQAAETGGDNEQHRQAASTTAEQDPGPCSETAEDSRRNTKRQWDRDHDHVHMTRGRIP